MRYRNVVLAAFFLDRPAINDAGTVYFPGDEFPFTRVYEPRNRSAAMSPPGRTSLVAEIPCSAGDDAWTSDDASVLRLVQGHLERIGWLRPGEILGTAVRRMPPAYPVLETGYEARVEQVHGHLARFGNLRFSGRSGKFRYSWLHEMLRFGKDIVDEVVADGERAAG
jgi:protoporphyrinogen oxidase